MLTESRPSFAVADAPRSTRLAWPDVARGITVLLVVAMHVYYLQVVPLLGDAPARAVHSVLIDLVTPVRMPLFFLLSGFLSARMLQRSWRAGFSGRIAPRFYLYVVWLAITGLVLGVQAWATGYPGYSFFAYALPQLLLPDSVLWYLWALAAYFAVARATRAIPASIAVAAAAAAALVVAPLIAGPMAPIVASFVWFLAGARLPRLVRDLSERPSRVLSAALPAAAVALLLLRQQLGPLPVLDLVTSVAGVAAVLVVLPRISEARVLRPIRHVGRNTLAIFAMHPLLIIGAELVLRGTPWLRAWIVSDWWASLLVPAVEVVLIAVVALLLQHALRRVGLRHLFEMPRWRRLRAHLALSRAAGAGRRLRAHAPVASEST